MEQDGGTAGRDGGGGRRFATKARHGRSPLGRAGAGEAPVGMPPLAATPVAAPPVARPAAAKPPAVKPPAVKPPVAKTRIVARASRALRPDTPVSPDALDSPDHAPSRALAALLHGRLRLALQPVRPLAAPDRLAFCEALARVPGPEGEMISAGRFAAALEARGLAPLLDRAALDGALALLGRDRGARISVNVSACTLGDARWMRRLEQAAQDDPDAARRLVVELTETAAAPAAEARRFRDRVGRAGPAFALDDFGSGHADATLARAVAPDIIKLDARLCAPGACPRALDAAMVVARRLEAMTVGEGVETQADAARLAALGVDAAQGWWLGRPSLAAAA